MNRNAVIDLECFPSQLDVILLQVLIHTPVPVALYGLADNRLLYANNQYREVFLQNALDQETGVPPTFNIWCSSPQLEQLVAEVRKNGKVDNFETCLKTFSGQRIWALISSVLIGYEGVQGILTSFQDISYLHEIEEDLNNFIRNQEVRFQRKRHKLEQVIGERDQALAALLNSKLLHRELEDNNDGC